MMGEKSTERKRTIAKRKKQFLTLVFGVVFALLPTSEVLASITINTSGTYYNVESIDGNTVKPNESVKWTYSRPNIGSGKMRLKVVYKIPDGEDKNIIDDEYFFSTGKTCVVDYSDCGLSDLDHWEKTGDPVFNEEDHYKSCTVTLQPVMKQAKVTVNVSPAGAGTANATKGGSAVSTAATNDTIDLKAEAASGYEFKNWTSDNTNITKTGFDKNPASFTVNNISSDIVITANFVKKEEPATDKVTVTFDYNGGSGDVASRTIDKGAQIGELPTGKKDGYEQEGWFTKKEGGEEVKSSTTFNESTTIYAHWTESKPSPESKPKPWRVRKSGDGDTVDNTPAAKVNPDAIAAFYYVNGVIQSNALIGKQEQSALATSVFKAAVPAGWHWAFSMSMSLNGKNEYSLKNGTIKLYVPFGYQKSGRQFAFLAMDKNGNVVFLPDQDLLPNMVTVTPNLEGYAYVLIYKD